MPIHQSDKREIIEEIVRLLYRGLHKNQMENPDPGESMSKYISAPSNQIGIRVLTIVDNWPEYWAVELRKIKKSRF